MSTPLVGLLLFAAACSSGHRTQTDLTTIAERSGYLRTGRYDEAVQLCRDFARTYDRVHCDTIGTTGEGRPIVAVRVAQARSTAPTIYIQAGIHAGEIEGKDAGFAFLRDLLDGKVARGALDAAAFIFVPVINPDGHERFGPNHRPNQRGPEEMGFRTNGARLNLNRDFVKAETPEIQAVIGLLRKHAPVMLVDLHTTDGAKFQHDIAVLTSPVAPRADNLDATAAALGKGIVDRLAQRGHLPVSFYPAFLDDEDPLSGFAAGEAPPRFSQSYAAARGALGVLVETHSWRTYPERAKSTYHTLLAIAELAVREAPVWQRATRAAQRADERLRGSVTLSWKTTEASRTIEFRGYAFEKVPSELSGGTWLRYDENTPQIWSVPLFEGLAPAITVEAPAGYVVEGGYAKLVVAVLDRHGLRHVPITGRPTLDVEVFRARKVTVQPGFEGRARVSLEGAWAREGRTLDQGAIFVPVQQPHGRLVLQLFEPALPDSLAQWGYFNTVFERKEYIEAYVMEEVARAMIAKDPALRAEFDAAVAADGELAKSPARRLDWFYRRSPAWDERVDLLPVYRASTPP